MLAREEAMRMGTMQEGGIQDVAKWLRCLSGEMGNRRNQQGSMQVSDNQILVTHSFLGKKVV